MSPDMEMFDQTASRIAVLENEVKNIATDVKEIRKEQKEQHDLLMNKVSDMSNRVDVLERWRWMIVGAAVVIGYILAHVRLDKLF
jgi:hypothetical protein